MLLDHEEREERAGGGDGDANEDEVHRVLVSVDGEDASVVRESLDVADIGTDALDDLLGSLAGDGAVELALKTVLEERGREGDAEDGSSGTEEVRDSGRGGHVDGGDSRDEGNEGDGEDSSVSGSVDAG